MVPGEPKEKLNDDPIKASNENQEPLNNEDVSLTGSDNTGPVAKPDSEVAEFSETASSPELNNQENIEEKTADDDLQVGEESVDEKFSPNEGDADAGAGVDITEKEPETEVLGDDEVKADDEKSSANEGDADAGEGADLTENEPEPDVNGDDEVKADDEKSEAHEKKSVRKRTKAKTKEEDDTEESGSAEEKVNFSLLSKPDLVKLLEEILNNRSFDQLRSEVEEIQAAYNEKHEKEIAGKKEKYIAEGGVEEDFKPFEDPVDRMMVELMEKYRTLKADFTRQLEATKEENLGRKQEILEEFRLLMEGQESFESTFRKFKQLQSKWFDVGIVPKQNVKDLWSSYNYFVDKFNDYVKINRELRVLDLKKNLDLKLKLCEKAEELAGETNIGKAFKVLQKYHAQWREIGPVPREDKDAIWERFRVATSVINRAHQSFQSGLKDSLVENLEKKQRLCAEAEAIAGLQLNSHSEWNDRTNDLLRIQKEWKTIGYAPKKDNNLIYARFRKACDHFFEKKAEFYSKSFEDKKENFEAKKAIIEAANELKESTDWKKTTEKLIELQKQWKEIGPVPRKETEKLWKQFRAACDYFFTNKSEYFSGPNESYGDNLKEKESLVEEIRDFTPSNNKNENFKALEQFQARFTDIGFVPVEDKDRIRDEYHQALNDAIDKMKVAESDKSVIRYRIRIAGMIQNPKAANKLRFERDKLMNKLQQLKNDISVWENNIGFFKQTESSEGTISDFNEKIELAKNRISALEKKIMIIDEFEDESG